MVRLRLVLITLLYQWGTKMKMAKMLVFDIDLANAVFEQYGIKVKWQSINWDMKETGIE